jgi:CHASE2 domain-containing sensor protein
MGVALARKTVKEVPPGLNLFAESFRQKNDTSLSKNEFLVDYSPLEILVASAPDVLKPAELAKVDLKDKIVLLGRTKNTIDTFTVAGRPEQAYAGVFLHACAAYTLLERRPLYRLTEFGRVWFDVGFSLLIFGPALLIRLSRHKRGKEVVVGHRMLGLLITFEAVLLVVGAVLLVRWTHLMWDDFILVVIVLVAHSPIERATVEIGRWLDGTLRPWRRASSPAPGSHSEGEG